MRVSSIQRKLGYTCGQGKRGRGGVVLLKDRAGERALGSGLLQHAGQVLDQLLEGDPHIWGMLPALAHQVVHLGEHKGPADRLLPSTQSHFSRVPQSTEVSAVRQSEVENMF